jgi:flavin reductase (DIM6/NTAB) family NADH-FMN oxidoreductase RutF
MHVRSESPLLYFGTPVVLISTLNEDGSANLAPMSSAWWLGWRCMLGMGATSKTTQNVLRTGECVLNLPSVDQVAAVDALARTTGTDPVPAPKLAKGYRFEAEKFALAGVTAVASEIAAAPRVAECPVQMEASLATSRRIAADDPTYGGFALALEVGIERLHLDESILMNGNSDRVDPDAWRPLIMSFAQFYGLAGGASHPSELARIPERHYPRAGAGYATRLTGAH